jgi:diaminopropionate ammonia-lyase
MDHRPPTVPEHRHTANPRRLTAPALQAAETAVHNLQGWDATVAEIGSWPEYRAQPTWSLPRTAERLGLGGVYYKDESRRFGRRLGSFKALGAPYTVFTLLRDAVQDRTGLRPTAHELQSGKYADITSRVTVCVATDGNQGRGLAYGARTFGCRCVVYIHAGVSAGRKAAMEDLGAVVIRTDGEYEESVDRAKQDAAMNGWSFVSSTSWADFAEAIPRRVMNGYMVMVEEAVAQVPEPERITHVVMQGGVGSIAAAIFLGFAARVPGTAARFVVVEPAEADCLYRSAAAGRPTPSGGTNKTMMAGLACGEVSPAAWKILDAYASDFVAVPDDWAIDGMRALADGSGDIPIVSGESTGAGMGMLVHARQEPDLCAALGLDRDSRVLLFGGEGATDPALYEQHVGQHPDAVFARQAAAAAVLR